jgi:hypothetical protein
VERRKEKKKRRRRLLAEVQHPVVEEVQENTSQGHQAGLQLPSHSHTQLYSKPYQLCFLIRDVPRNYVKSESFQVRAG